jgi:alkylation response protein AidB-like acyl-CoA dehydrogenase
VKEQSVYCGVDIAKWYLDAAMAKLFVSESFVKSCLDAIQVHGGAGFMTELELERGAARFSREHALLGNIRDST